MVNELGQYLNVQNTVYTKLNSVTNLLPMIKCVGSSLYYIFHLLTVVSLPSLLMSPLFGIGLTSEKLTAKTFAFIKVVATADEQEKCI